MKGVDTLIGAILIITISLTLAALIGPWMMRLAQESQNQTGDNVDKEIYCREMSYDFVQDYGINGVSWDFSGASDYLRVKVKNYGTVNVYGFSFELELADYSLIRLEATQISQKPKASPLRVGESAVIEANITQDITQNLSKVSVRNVVGCTPLSQKV
jgi:hypothetical protein